MVIFTSIRNETRRIHTTAYIYIYIYIYIYLHVRLGKSEVSLTDFKQALKIDTLKALPQLLAHITSPPNEEGEEETKSLFPKDSVFFFLSFFRCCRRRYLFAMVELSSGLLRVQATTKKKKESIYIYIYTHVPRKEVDSDRERQIQVSPRLHRHNETSKQKKKNKKAAITHFTSFFFRTLVFSLFVFLSHLVLFSLIPQQHVHRRLHVAVCHV